MILVDTSIWIDHIKHRFDEHLDWLLAGESVLMHDFVFGEIALGSLRNRREQLAIFADLHRVPTAADHEVQTLVETADLHGTGLSYIDAHLLTAARASPDSARVRLWTRDKRLHKHAKYLDVAYEP